MKDYQFEHWHQDPLSRKFRAAIIEAIKMHGPITKDHSKVNSVVKRVYGVFKAYQKGEYDEARNKASIQKMN